MSGTAHRSTGIDVWSMFDGDVALVFEWEGVFVSSPKGPLKAHPASM
jgi:hypothetical protein